MPKILIVDDEPRIRDLIRAHLEHENFTCEEASDGGAALAALSLGGIDLVILDVMMPFVDGMTCLREMRSLSLIHISSSGCPAPAAAECAKGSG